MDKSYQGSYIDDSKLYSFAVSCARLNRPEGTMGSGALSRSMRASCRTVTDMHSYLCRRYESCLAVPTACRWIMDNAYIVKREYLAAAGDMKYRRIRSCQSGAMVMAMCRALLSSGEGKLTAERCTVFMEGFQSVTALTLAELSLVPVLLRAVIFEEIASICVRMRSMSDPDSFSERLGALFFSLRLIGVTDWGELLDSVNISGRILSEDPTGEYPLMDAATRAEYLRRLEKLASRRDMSQPVLAEEIVKKARREGRHIGFYLFPRRKSTGEGIYIAANVLFTLGLSLYLGFLTGSRLTALLLLLPVWELQKSLLDYLLLITVKPRPVLRMDMSHGVPPEGRTLCVVSTILEKDSVRRLRELRLASRQEGRELFFGVLADLPPEKRKECDYDEPLISASRREINRLNREFGGGFYLFTRPRSFDGDSYCGHERKRGAILELCKLICDEGSALTVSGEADALHSVKYIITLDSDTEIYPGALGELIGAMLHPLCKPVVDQRRGRVVAGHAILHPRIETELESACATDFALIFAPAGGSDPYGSLCSEVYMDAFDNGGFPGKGIIDPRALLSLTADRIPEGRVLSHDALEGAYLRGGYVGDTAFSDRFPAKPLGYYKRQHRWVRGDWQNGRWIFHRELGSLDRFRLLDSLRRSLIPVVTLAAIVWGFSCSGRGVLLAAWAALLSLITGLIFALVSSVRDRQRVHIRRHTRILSGLGGAIVGCFLRLWLLPFECYVNLSAIVLSLWRMFVSKKHLLQWQTAAQSEKCGNGLGDYVRSMWFAVVLGVLLTAFSPEIIGKASGFMWLLSPAALWALSLPSFRVNDISGANREYILERVRENWEYLSRYSSPEDNYLPADNYQEQPPVGTAHRSSPTNIGLAMAAAAACADMGIITREAASEYIGNVTDTLLKLPRYDGHFCNWYDTRSLKPLEPVYISTVDSGNLYAGLLSCRIAAEEWGKAELAEKLRSILEPMDFSSLYDSQRALFYICRDALSGEGKGGWYDLMGSEAMLTSYIAVCRGDVPVKHWRTLSRAQLQKDGYRGLASWTGTMFEYLMPFLFLPLYRSSLLYESSRFCLYAQKKRVPRTVPWGISESAYACIDSNMAYRYKASGCAALSLKRGQDEDLVVSPYSSFLAMCLDPNGASSNLRRLQEMGAVGRYGFYEAVDFTRGRCRNGNGEKVRCYMAHHVSMSIIAAANALCEHSVRERFISEPMMGARKLLLQERILAGGDVIRRSGEDIPEKPRPSQSQRWQTHGGSGDGPGRCCVLSNGGYSIMLTSSGISSAKAGAMQIYREPPRLALEGREIFPREGLSAWELSEEEGRFTLGIEGTEMTVTVSPSGMGTGEVREVEITPGSTGRYVLSFSFIPMLCTPRDYDSHPAYWQLGIEAYEEGDCYLLRRLERQGGDGMWLALSCGSPGQFSYEYNTVTLCVPLDFRKGEKLSLRFALAVSPSKREAMENAGSILHRSDRFSMVTAASLRLGMSREEIGEAMDMLQSIMSTSPVGGCARSELWPFGISGDYPLLMCPGDHKYRLNILRRFCLLRNCGAECELVFLTDEAGEYLQPMMREASEELTRLGLDPLIGARGGVFFVPKEQEAVIRSRSVWSPDATEKHDSLPPQHPGDKREALSVPEYRFEEGVFKFYVNRSLPSRCWQNILTNGSMGYIAADTGMGNLWFKNAREMPLNLPPRSIRGITGPEYAAVSLGGEHISLFAANDGHRCIVSYSPGSAIWEKDIGGRTVRTAVFIPAGIDARVLLIRGGRGMRLLWGTEVTMGSDGAAVRISENGGIISCFSRDAYYADTVLRIGFSGPAAWKYDYSPGAVSAEAILEDDSVLVLGCCRESEILDLCKLSYVNMLYSDTVGRWKRLCDRVRLESPEPMLDRFISPWCVYQCIAGRLQGRSSLYQSGGAIGFRDQLQDSVNMMLISPAYARDQIILCCRHQYKEGDVMHWWHPHPDGDKGVRTRCSDDLLWLVWALCDYVNLSGDREICAVTAEYLASRPLGAQEDDRYECPERSREAGTVLDHAKRALLCCESRGFGEHGLPLMGSCDWNDAMNDVRGESLWLGWFLSIVSGRFAELLKQMGEDGAEHFRELSEEVGLAADKCFNGHWYPRAYFPDGEAIGDSDRIDSVAQSFAAFCPYSSPEKLRSALSAAEGRLLDRERHIIKLFDPPVSENERRLGYISGYGKGYRENGGQYTHGAIWLAMAMIKAGRISRGWEMLRMLLPENRDMGVYGAEPYIIPADISAAGGHEGEAGWTWYTGSAGWYFRAVTEYVFGLRLRGGKLTLSPALPNELQGSRVVWRDSGGTKHEIYYGDGVITVDGEKYSGGEIG